MISLPIGECARLIEGKSDYVRIGFRKIEHAGHVNLLNKFLNDVDRRIVVVSSYFCRVAYGKSVTSDLFLLETLKDQDVIVTVSNMTIDIAKQATFYTRTCSKLKKVIKDLELPEKIYNEAIGMFLKDAIEKTAQVMIGSRLIIPYMFAKTYFPDLFVDNYVPVFGSFRDEQGILHTTTSSIPQLSLDVVTMANEITLGKAATIADLQNLCPLSKVVILSMDTMSKIDEISDNCFIISTDGMVLYDFLTIKDGIIIL